MNESDLYKYRGNPSLDTLKECLRVYEMLGHLDLHSAFAGDHFSATRLLKFLIFIGEEEGSADTARERLRLYTNLRTVDFHGDDQLRLLQEIIANGVPALRQQIAERA